MPASFFRKIVLIFIVTSAVAQTEIEVAPPYNIKTASFTQSGNNVVPIFELGTGFQFQFDDLFGNEANYYYEIVHCDYNWVPTNIPKTEYLKGFDGQRIQQYENSFNTLQTYSHYQLPIPNQFSQLIISGNYILKILNEDKDVVLSRKFIVYENIVTVPMRIRRARMANYLDYKHNIEFSINSLLINFQNPLKNVKVMILQNGQFNTAIKNVPPQYTLGNELIYKYDSETQFWAGNEFLYFDNNNIRAAGNNVAQVSSTGGIYSASLYTNDAKANSLYSLFPDNNGNFVTRSISATKPDIESDYVWIYFSLSAPAFMSKKNIYVNGMFNNYSLSPEYKMDFNPEKNLYEKAVLIKQGYTNFQYQVADNKGNVDAEKAPDGNFWQTENEYTILVYYKQNTDRYERVIGKASANSNVITN